VPQEQNKRLLFVVASDPRSSGRPAEAIRIAAGVGAWKRVDLDLYLRGPAVLVLSEYPDDLAEADNYTRYLPIIREWMRPIYVERGAPLLKAIGATTVPYQEIAERELAEIAAASSYVARF
jgi:hypothetical protein